MHSSIVIKAGYSRATTPQPSNTNCNERFNRTPTSVDASKWVNNSGSLLRAADGVVSWTIAGSSEDASVLDERNNDEHVYGNLRYGQLSSKKKMVGLTNDESAELQCLARKKRQRNRANRTIKHRELLIKSECGKLTAGESDTVNRHQSRVKRKREKDKLRRKIRLSKKDYNKHHDDSTLMRQETRDNEDSWKKLFLDMDDY